MRLKREREKKIKEGKIPLREKSQKEKEGKKSDKKGQKKREKKSEKQLVIKKSLFIKPKEVKRVMLARQPMYLLIPNYKCLSSSALELPQGFDTLLNEFEDVFPQDIPHGLPPLRGIEHQIDLVLGASLPNRVTYRSNPEETKEIQKQVEIWIMLVI